MDVMQRPIGGMGHIARNDDGVATCAEPDKIGSSATQRIGE